MAILCYRKRRRSIAASNSAGVAKSNENGAFSAGKSSYNLRLRENILGFFKSRDVGDVSVMLLAGTL